jgi:hypothetical protein
MTAALMKYRNQDSGEDLFAFLDLQKKAKASQLVTMISRDPTARTLKRGHSTALYNIILKRELGIWRGSQPPLLQQIPIAPRWTF